MGIQISVVMLSWIELAPVVLKIFILVIYGINLGINYSHNYLQLLIE